MFPAPSPPSLSPIEIMKNPDHINRGAAEQSRMQSQALQTAGAYLFNAYCAGVRHELTIVEDPDTDDTAASPIAPKDKAAALEIGRRLPEYFGSEEVAKRWVTSQTGQSAESYNATTTTLNREARVSASRFL